MMRIFLSLIGLIFLACGNQLLEKPDDLIPRDQMVDILYDMSLLDAIGKSHPGVIESNDLDVMDFLYEKYDIDSLKFAESDKYYASLPETYQDIYEEVEGRLSRQRDSISEVIQQGQQTEADTIPTAEDYD